MINSSATLANATDKSFADLGLSEPILKCIENVGFKHPTPIQNQIIPVALQGTDVVGLAQTGSGKTAAFALPLSERLTHGEGLRGLIMCPTREIALQTRDFLNLFGKNHHLTTVCLIGGVRMGPQIQDMKKKPDIIVATPGRLYDFLERKLVDLSHIQELVLDEADHMLDMGFLPQIERIMRRIPVKRHTMMFSATMPESIERLARRFLHNPVRVDILPEGRAAEGITHQLYLVKWENKEDCLLSLLKNTKEDVTLIFTRMKMDVDWLAKALEKAGHTVAKIHSNLSQGEREQSLKGFRAGQHRILVATDIAARGIDVPGIHHIINYDIPENVEDYIHRAGRTARGNAVGVVSTIATWQDKPMVKQIEAALGSVLPRCVAEGVEAYVEFKKDPKHDMSRRRR